VSVAVWVWIAFIFVFGCCVGSFLNVVIYRLPLDKSLIRPGSSCPACGRFIQFYDNVPLVSWLALRAKCRYCKAAISPRYFVIELLTGSVFLGVFVLYFCSGYGPRVPPLGQGGWLVYLIHIFLLSSFIAASAIDLELSIIPVSICWLATVVGIVGSGLGGYVIDPALIVERAVPPRASAATGALAAGAAIGLAVSWLLLLSGLIKRSYESPDADDTSKPPDESKEPQFNDRAEICKEVLFLLPIIICSVGAYLICRQMPAADRWWQDLCQRPVIAGVLGSVWGYFVGCAVVWTTRILGTLGFGREAMGLGDVHLMGAAGAVVGAVPVFVAFFIAPFYGLIWAVIQMFFKKSRQIPYGPWLSLAVFTVMILRNQVIYYWSYYWSIILHP
jgi:leader peptidase (prepilin peptidase)/N-methyltransferase